MKENPLEFFCPAEIFSTHKPYGHWFEDTKKTQITSDLKKLAKALIEAVLIIAVLVGIIWLLGSLGTAHAEEAKIGFPAYWEFTKTDVANLQEKLNTYGFSLKVDGIFGPKTGAAVKKLQWQLGLRATGVADDTFCEALRIRADSTMYYMADLQKVYGRSDYEDVVYVSLGGRGYDPNRPPETGSHLWLFRNGGLVADCPCVTGDESKAYFTPLGSHRIKGRQWQQNEGWKIQLSGQFCIRSAQDGQTLGAHSSTNGDIIVPEDFAGWLALNEPDGVTVVVDDRAYSPAGAPGYQHLLDEEGEWSDYADWEREEELIKDGGICR